MARPGILLLAGLLVTTLLVGGTPPPDGVGSAPVPSLESAPALSGREQDLAAHLGERNDSVLAAVQRGDAERAATFYTDDGLLLPPDGTVVRGREAIRSFWAASGGFDSVSTSLLAVRSDAHMASHIARYTIWSSGEDGRSRRTGGVFLIVWQREGGGVWRILADMWN